MSKRQIIMVILAVLILIAAVLAVVMTDKPADSQSETDETSVDLNDSSDATGNVVKKDKEKQDNINSLPTR